MFEMLAYVPAELHASCRMVYITQLKSNSFTCGFQTTKPEQKLKMLPHQSEMRAFVVSMKRVLLLFIYKHFPNPAGPNPLHESSQPGKIIAVSLDKLQAAQIIVARQLCNKHDRPGQENT